MAKRSQPPIADPDGAGKKSRSRDAQIQTERIHEKVSADVLGEGTKNRGTRLLSRQPVNRAASNREFWQLTKESSRIIPLWRRNGSVDGEIAERRVAKR
jgi:hypothetical protein